MDDEKNILEDLPQVTLNECKKCGAKSNEWTKCNIDDQNNVIDCDKCPELVH